MAFNSYIFILVFLPITLIGYYILPSLFTRYNSKIFLIIASAIFIFYGFNWAGLLFLMSSICINYILYLLIRKSDKNHTILYVSIIVNVLLLFILKYSNAILAQIEIITNSTNIIQNLILPVGISFYTFQQISFLVDASRGEIPDCTFATYCCYVSFFPRVISGPIIRHEQFIPQLNDKKLLKFNWDNFSRGLFRFSIGLAKKVLVADLLAEPANLVFSNPTAYTGINMLIGIISFSLELYFDFSGYSDMAIGVSKMLNYDIPENFNSPYKALNIKEFWARWHISLTNFLTKYIYFPLGGSRKGTVRTIVNILIIFLISGLWHGSNHILPFVIWGLAHGIASVIYRYGKKFFDRLHPILNWLITMTFVSLAWIPFRAASLSDASIMVKNLYSSWNTMSISSDIGSAFKLQEISSLQYVIAKVGMLDAHPWIYCAVFIGTTMVVIIKNKNSKEITENLNYSLKTAIIISILLTWSIISLSKVGTFIYAGF